MRRPLALLAAAWLLRPGPARGDPLDMSLPALGPPSPGVWLALQPGLTSAQAAQYASDARQRFGLLSSEMGLALSSVLLTPADTVGHSGFEFGLDFGYAQVHAPVVGAGPYARDYWPVRSTAPGGLRLPSLHVRKGLPFSFEIGGRAIYLDQSSMVATQLELRWAINEGISYLPDFALRSALTHLFGQRDWDLSTLELDLMVGKRFGVGGVLSLAPYGAVRFTWLAASSEFLNFGSPLPPPDPKDSLATVASYPQLQLHDHTFVRYTLGVRLVAAAFTLSAEATFFPGKTFDGPAPDQLGALAYPSFTVPSSWSGGGNLGLTF
jgi:hypothetical protein